MSDELVKQLINNGSLPRSIRMQDGGGIINRLRDIRQEFDAGACGPLPLRVTAHGVGGLKQQPLKAGYMVLEKGNPDTGQDETRENKIRRFTGGPAPMASSKLLHLIAEDLNPVSYTHLTLPTIYSV